MSLPVVLTDIEGTTSSISFVRDVLFPFARERLPAFVREHADEPKVRQVLADTAKESGLAQPALDTLIATLIAWIDEDRKATPLKALQGMIWQAGYAQRDFTAHIYDDALRGLRRWHAAGHPIYVYSSGSVPAQRLYFAHTTAGDLSNLFEGYFDTTSGPKREAESYRRIAAEIGTAAKDIVFLSDIDAEVDAASAAGMRTVWVRRDTSAAPVANSPQTIVSTFDQIEL